MNDTNFISPETLAVLTEYGLDLTVNVVLAALILVVGFVAAGLVKRRVRAAAARSTRIDETLAAFFGSLAYYGIIVIVAIAVLSRFGVETTSLVAALGAATLAVGLALQGTLSNLAAGVMIVLFRPYSLGDWVEVGGVSGTVKDINLFTTELAPGDLKQVIVPNGQIWGHTIMNFSTNPVRRVDFVFSIDYSNDIDKAMSVIHETLTADERVHREPAVFTAVSAHAESAIEITARAWVDAGDFWGVRFDALRSVKLAFDRNGISIPYPHRVHIARKD